MRSTSPQQRQADWRQGWILVISGFLPVMAIIALAPTLPTLLAHFHDIPHAALMVPLLITAPSACIALFAPGAGAIADRFGRRPLLLWSMAFYGAGGLVPFAIDNFWAVVAGRFVIGIGEAGVLTVVNTLLADYFEEKARPSSCMRSRFRSCWPASPSCSSPSRAAGRAARPSRRLRRSRIVSHCW
jgi:MFS family permease